MNKKLKPNKILVLNPNVKKNTNIPYPRKNVIYGKSDPLTVKLKIQLDPAK